MKSAIAGIVTFAVGIGASLVAARFTHAGAPSPSWNPRAAAAYLDGRADWWLHWPSAARDHDTSCISCHTAVPYALARPALRTVLRERDWAAPERLLLANVVTRVRRWRDVEPFYPDQTRGLPKTSESRGTEAVLNALILATREASKGALTLTLTDDARQAFDNLWPLQFTAGDLRGAWAWLDFHNAPWESSDSPYYGAALAALAVGSAPGDYASRPEIQDHLKLLREYLGHRADTESLFNRLTVLWASTKLPGLLTPAQRQSIVDAAVAKQQDDGGWSLSALGSWKRADATAQDAAGDGYATGLITLALQQSGTSGTEASVSKGLSWLARHQDAASGRWVASSLNKHRDAASDTGKFMSDAATAYAVLALTSAR